MNVAFDKVYGSERPPVASVLELARADAYAAGSYEWGDKLAQAATTAAKLAEAVEDLLEQAVGRHNELSHDFVKDERGCDQCALNRKARAALTAYRGEA